MLELQEASGPSGVRWRENVNNDSAPPRPETIFTLSSRWSQEVAAAEATPADSGGERKRSSGKSSWSWSGSVNSVYTIHYGIQNHLLATRKSLWRYASKLYHFIIWCLMLMSFMVANVILPVTCGIQMLILDYVLAGESLTKQPWVWIFCACELCLVGHLMVNNTQLHAVRSGSFQWITYSWLISIKSCLLFFHVLPDLQVKEMDFARGSFKSTKKLVTILWLTPMFYTVLSFRTLRELSQTGHTRKERHHGARNGTRELQRDLEEHSRMDVVLLTDMVWHVFIDMIDIIYMMFMSNPYDDSDSIMDPVFMKERPETVKQIRRAVGIIVFLGLFFHQQSFPRIGYVGGSRAERRQPAAHLMRQGAMSILQRTPQSPTQDPTPQQRFQPWRQGSVSSMTGLPSPSVGTSDSKPAAEYWVDVVKARKRSAIVSILMVDLPFLIIRTYLIMLSLNLQAQPDNHSPRSPLHGILPQVDKWWVKNILCLVLQAMQLRFVQQADLERSCNLSWWDMHISVTKAAAVGTKLRKSDKLLAKMWRDLDRGKLQAAMEDTGGATTTSGSERTGTDDEGRRKGPQNLPAPPLHTSSVGSTQSSGTTSAASTNSRRRSSGSRRCRCLCCCRRRPCRCCNCDCSSGILTHALMGSLLGWLIAKVDFTQDLTDLVMGLHTER